MPRGKVALAVLFCCAAVAVLVPARPVVAGEISSQNYKVLQPITRGNLTIFPVVTSGTHDTGEFLTLDEGVRSGDVVVTEAGQARGLVRGPRESWRTPDSARVNQLVLINNSKRPLLLLAGEIVTGGKQDRVIAKDRIVPALSDPIDLGVFCVEPGRWTATSDKFGTSHGSIGGLMVQPRVRSSAMAAKNQQQVWKEVGRTQSEMTAMAGPVASGSLNGTTSYARVMTDAAVQQKVDAVATPIEHDYTSVMGQLKDRNAVGVVVAVGGHIIWADVFASNALLQKYWPKLIRSYAAQAVVERAASGSKFDTSDAQKFLDQMSGTHEVAESEPGLFRQAEISGEGYKVFELTSLLPKTGFDVHVAKMAE